MSEPFSSREPEGASAPLRQHFIVAEISKSWINGTSATPLIAEQFEAVINHNFERGYILASWQLHRVILDEGNFNETIVAVFEWDGMTEPPEYPR